jgi:hypothetical protein
LKKQIYIVVLVGLIFGLSGSDKEISDYDYAGIKRIEDSLKLLDSRNFIKVEQWRRPITFNIDIYKDSVFLRKRVFSEGILQFHTGNIKVPITQETRYGPLSPDFLMMSNLAHDIKDWVPDAYVEIHYIHESTRLYEVFWFHFNFYGTCCCSYNLEGHSRLRY